MSRAKERENAFILLFQTTFKGAVPEDIVEASEEVGEISAEGYTKILFDGVTAKEEEIDLILEKHLVGWKKNRISHVSLTAIRIAIYEMFFCDDIDDSVAISQALELLKKYDDEKSVSFANGVLGSCSRDKNG